MRQLLENILSNTLLVRPNYAVAVELLAALALCALVILLTPVLTATTLIVSSLLFLAAFGIGSYGLFQTQRLLVDRASRCSRG